MDLHAAGGTVIRLPLLDRKLITIKSVRSPVEVARIYAIGHRITAADEAASAYLESQGLDNLPADGRAVLTNRNSVRRAYA